MERQRVSWWPALEGAALPRLSRWGARGLVPRLKPQVGWLWMQGPEVDVISHGVCVCVHACFSFERVLCWPELHGKRKGVGGRREGVALLRELGKADFFLSLQASQQLPRDSFL